MKSQLLYYDHIASFKRQFYKDLLLPEHVQGSKVFMKSITFEDGEIDDNYNFMGWVLEKNGIKYLLPHRKNKKTIELEEVLPIVVRSSVEVSHQSTVYKLIKRYASAKITAEQKYSFKEFINNLTALGHSNDTHQTLMAMVGVSSMYSRNNFRVSTPPGFGKDSAVDILGNLIGKAGTITSPSYPKLEERSTMWSWLVVNEIVSMKKGDWDTCQQYLLDAGAFKPVLTKRTRATAGVPEEIEASNLSIGLFYNDIMNYPDASKYFDYVTLDAVKDRFPALRFHGKFTEDFSQLKVTNIDEYAKRNTKKYKDLLYTFEYYKENLGKHLHKYTHNLPSMPQRWITNMERLLNIVDCYCDTQEEFDGYVTELLKAMDDYKAMISFNEYIKVFVIGQGMEEEIVEKTKGISTMLRKVKSKIPHLKTFLEAVEDEPTYIGKNILLQNFQQNRDYKNNSLEKY